jgi:hypothetical protein
MGRDRRFRGLGIRRWVIVTAVVFALFLPRQVRAAGDTSVSDYSGLTTAQQATLMGIARDTWKFYSVDVDPTTHLPMDNLTFAGGSSTPTGYGRYTSAANIGVYMWAVVAAADLGLISHADAVSMLTPTLTELGQLSRYKGFLYQWYDTTNGHVIRNPGDVDCSTETTPTFDNCYFISNVDNGWYASGLIVARQAFPELASTINGLMSPMDFGIFYDNRPETSCNVNTAIPGNQPTGQMYGGVYVGLPVDQGTNWQHYYHNGALYSDPRISAYIGMGLHQMPGNVWWRSWRALPPKQCPTDPDFSWQGQPQVPGRNGHWQVYTDPQSGQQFNVWEGHYTYPNGGPNFVPTYNGGMFEGEMVNEVVPETSWGPTSFGLNDLLWAEVQIRYATEQLHYPVWGISPSSTPDDSGNYNGYGAAGDVFPSGQRISQCNGCSPEDTVTPHASFLALDVLPQQAFANIQQLRALYPGVYGTDGFFDAVNPTTGAVGHRILVLDDSMIMAALDNALENRAMQRHFAADSVAPVIQPYLAMEHMTISHIGMVNQSGGWSASFTSSFTSAQPGQGEVYFGTGPGCQGLIQVATADQTAGTTQHTVVVSGNDLPGTIGNIGLTPGVTYWYENVTVTPSGTTIDNNNGKCYSITIPTSGA